MARELADRTSNAERLKVCGGGRHSTGRCRSDEDVDRVRQAVEEVVFPSKCRTTDAANDGSQNCSEEPTSRPIQITGSPET
jgi:hypothetical protein